MRINFILPIYPHAPSGGFRVIYDYSDRLSLAGHTVTLYHAGYGGLGTPVNRQRPEGSKSSRKYVRDLVRASNVPAWYRFHSENIKIVNRLLLRPSDIAPADVTVATACHTAPFVSGLPTSCGVGHYFIQHYETWDASEDFVEYTWRLDLKKIVIARWLADKARELGVEAQYVPNAIDVASFEAGPPPSKREIDICAMASPLPWKRLDLLIDVLAGLKAVRPHLTASVFGVEERDARLPNWVTYTRQPSREHLSTSIYQASKIYVCTSDAEGWHLPPGEAMASRCCVVSTDIGGVREYAEDIALFTSPGNSGDMVKAISSLLDDPAQMASRAQLGVDRMASYGPKDALLAFEQALMQPMG
jgi:glycosyltransferase involved in cell wall biosynthesis